MVLPRRSCFQRKMTILLETTGLTKDFGKFRALDNVSFSIEKGVLTSLIGPNGAGKTTFYNCITGKFPPTSGKIFFKEENITGLPAHTIQQKGLSRSFQIVSIFPELSVLDNIKAALIAKAKKNWRMLSFLSRDRVIHEEAMNMVELIGMIDRANWLCHTLSHGDRRRVDIGIALAARPDLILLDEPTAGMNPKETEEVIQLINYLRGKTETTFFITEHDMEVVFSISERIIVLHQGKVLADGTPSEIQENPSVQEVYLGGVL